MLQNIRDRFTGGFAIAILALLAVPFLFFGINYDFIGSSYAAKVNGDEIPIVAFDNEYRQQLANYGEFGSQLPQQMREMLKQNVLNNLIWELLVDQHLAEAGYRVNDEMVMDYIRSTPEFQQDGRFSKDLYYTWLANNGRMPAEFEANMRLQLRNAQLQRGISATAFITPAEYRRYLNLVREERDVSVATFDVAAIADTIEVSDEDIQAYYDERPDDFRSPETVDIKYVELNRTALGEQVEVTAGELQDYYEESRGRYLQDEQRQARHILIPFGDDEDAAEAQARALAERIRAGEPFADLARQHSADTGSAERGGDLGVMLHSQMQEELADPVFSMQPGEIAGPIRSDFGFHVVQLDRIEEGGPLPLAEVRAELEQELRAGKVEDLWREKERALSDALFDADDIETMAAEVGLPVERASGYTRQGGEPFGSNQAALDAIFQEQVLSGDRITDIIELDANRSVAVQVDEYNEAARRPLAEVRENIVTAIKQDRARAIVTEKSNELQAALRDGQAFQAAAEAAGAGEVAEQTIRRDVTDIDPNVRAAVFQARKPQPGEPRIGSVQTQDGNQAVYSVTGYTPGRPEAIPVAQRDEAKRRLAAQAGQSDFAAFVFQLEQQADIVRNTEAIEQQSML